MGSSHFARRYFGNRVFFLFLRLLRCFSSPGSLPYTMDSCMDDGGLLRRVSPFRYLRILGYLRLPAAFRSLSRLSSALSAKASTLRSWSFNLLWLFLPSLPFTPSVMLLGGCLIRFLLLRPEVLFYKTSVAFSICLCRSFLVNLFRFTSDVLFISFANLIIRFVQYSVFKVRGAWIVYHNFQGSWTDAFISH